jgi:hypothetical protein
MMEQQKEREIRRLVNVLKRMARTARMNYFMNDAGFGGKADRHSIDQFNRILERFTTMEAPGDPSLFGPLPEDATLSNLANACRDLCAYYEEEQGNGVKEDGKEPWSGMWTDTKSGIWIDKSAFRHGMPPEISDLGHFIREKIGEWQERKRKPE